MPTRVTISQSDLPGTDVEQSVFMDAKGDYQIVTGQATTESKLIEMAEGSKGLLLQYAEVSERVLASLPELKVISRYGIGVDTIDIDAATKYDVAVTNVPSYCEEEVATHALALLLSVVRNTSGYDKQIKSGLWDWKAGKPLLPMRNKTLGFMAFGKIPRTLIQITAGFDLEYIAYDPYLNPADVQDVPVEIVSWDELLTDSDYISIHAPLVNATRGKFNRAAFSKMQDNVILINTARGEIVDEDALDWALSKGEIFGAGIDVIEGEPRANSPLFNHENIVISPHVAWYSERSINELRRKAAENIVLYLQDQTAHGIINPEVIEPSFGHQ